jgi:cobalamin biosynthesis Mg chelatase CobN
MVNIPKHWDFPYGEPLPCVLAAMTLAEALALLGVQPVWDYPSRRVVDFEILPVSVLGRPRVDVTLRISGFFRDAFLT